MFCLNISKVSTVFTLPVDSSKQGKTTIQLYSAVIKNLFFFKTLSIKRTKRYVSKAVFSKLVSDRNVSELGMVHFYELELVGLGYRLSFNNNSLRLNLGYSHVIYLLMPCFVFCTKRKNKILIYSLVLDKLSSFVALLLHFKKINKYKLKGLKVKNVVYQLKSSKRVK